LSLLSVENLVTEYRIGNSRLRAVDDVSLVINESDVLGIVGESACGKTTLGKSIIRLLPNNARIINGKMSFRGRDILSLSEKDFAKIQWKELAYIPQSSMNALDPVYKISDQIIEAIKQHEKIGRKEALERAKSVLRLTGIDEKRLTDYPHHLSGGMKQRVLIGMALVLNPSLIVLDEPTTALDVISQQNVVEEILKLRDNFKTSLIFVTHDIALVAQVCHEVAVMYAAKIVELADVHTIFKEPSHPYTMGLQNAYPSIAESKELVSIPGFPPDLVRPLKGCRFSERCPFKQSMCEIEEPMLLQTRKGHYAACHFRNEAEEFRKLAENEATWSRNQ